MNETTKSPVKQDVYNIVTNRIIELLDAGTIPWRQPWTDAGLPRNLITMRPYKGINVWLLSALNYSRNYFLSWKQAQDLGGEVKEGEKPHIVVFWKWNEEEKADEANGSVGKSELKPKVLLRYYKVYNLAQCSGIPEEKIPVNARTKFNPLRNCESIVHHMPNRPTIYHEAPAAFYHIAKDFINMPKRRLFTDSESYYSTLFHELIHSTGHVSRLKRRGINEMSPFDPECYSQEELVAEMGACYLNSYAGIANATIENNAAYLNGWLKQLKHDKKFVIYASSFAQKATDYILNVQEDEIKSEIDNAEIVADN